MSLLPSTDIAALVCELRAPRHVLATGLLEIVTTCATDVGQPLELTATPLSSTTKESILVLHLSAQLAGSQDRVWCLACRLACFCPATRVSVMIHAQGAFNKRMARLRGAQRRSA